MARRFLFAVATLFVAVSIVLFTGSDASAKGPKKAQKPQSQQPAQESFTLYGADGQVLAVTQVQAGNAKELALLLPGVKAQKDSQLEIRLRHDANYAELARQEGEKTRAAVGKVGSAVGAEGRKTRELVVSDGGQTRAAVANDGAATRQAVQGVANQAVTVFKAVGDEGRKTREAVDGVGRKVDVVSRQATVIAEKVDEVARKVDSGNAKADANAAKMDAVAGKVDVTSGKLDGLKAQLDRIEELVKQLATKADMTSAFEQLKKDLTGLSDAQTQKILDGFEARLKALLPVPAAPAPAVQPAPASPGTTTSPANTARTRTRRAPIIGCAPVIITCN